jgi:hypothetical protein
MDQRGMFGRRSLAFAGACIAVLGFGLLAGCGTDPRYADLQAVARAAQERDRNRNQPSAAPASAATSAGRATPPTAATAAVAAAPPAPPPQPRSPAVARLSPPTDTRCALSSHLNKSLALERSGFDLLARQPWLKDVFVWCTGLAQGTSDEQERFIGSCLAQRCTAGPGCAAAIKDLTTTVVSNTGTRAQLLEERRTCEPQWSADVMRKGATAMDAFVNLQVAIVTGNDRRTRQLSMGSEDDYETMQKLVGMYASIERFFRAAAGQYGAVAAELARTQLTALTPRPAAPLETLEWVESARGVTIASMDRRVRSSFVREQDRWKVDLDEMMRSNPASVAAMLELLTFAFEEGTRYVEARRASSPTVAVSALSQCYGLGMFVMTASMERAKMACAELMDRRLQQAIGR